MARITELLRRRVRAAVEQERGMALMLVLMIMMLLSALMIGFMTSIMADTRSGGVDRDETQAYAVAHAGMEKLTSDLAALFLSDYSPNGTQISNKAANAPVISGFTYTDPDGTTGYKVQFTAKVGSANQTVNTPTTYTPVPDDPTTGTTIAAGPYQGFKGLVTHYNIMVTARSSGGSEVRMRRELQTVAVPVFQFGLFSESSLSFHSGSDFNFGGRVHTNGDIYIAGGNSTSNSLWLGDKVTAVGEVVRRYLDNGLISTTLYPGPVNMAKGTGVYRVLSATNNSGKGEGSVQQNLGSTENEPVWTALSVGTYNGYIRNGRTGAKRLDLPLVSNGAFPVDLIRRPVIAVPGEEDTNKLVYDQRYFSQASLRIMLSDQSANITGLPFIVSGTPPISLEAGTLYGPAGRQAPLALAGAAAPYKTPVTTPLIGGFIKIEMKKQSDGTYQDVTAEILNLGIAGRNIANGGADAAFNMPPAAGNAQGPNSAFRTVLNNCLDDEIQPDAIIRLQRVKDVPSTSANVLKRYHCTTDATTNAPSVDPTDYWPNALYDTREGLRRDEAGNNNAGDIRLGGVMYYIELDVNNLARWFKGTIGTNGGLAKNDNNGYIVYFSDRRNNRSYVTGGETGEYGNEDAINPASQSGASNGALDAGEDVNAYVPLTGQPAYVPVLDIYGNVPTDGQGNSNAAGAVIFGSALPLTAAARTENLIVGGTAVTAQIVRSNRPIFFRRALKLTNGSAMRGQYASPGFTGLTIASENPVYVQGDYNATVGVVATETHVACAIVADAITLLSNNWNDIRSFAPDPVTVANKPPTSTGYRFAAVTGKNISFIQPTNWATPETNFGMDGGAHNLLRQLEDWGAAGTITYRGSIVSFYIARQAIGTFMCCRDTYTPGTRAYSFDTDFLLPDKLPPGTPMFRDVNTLTFRQVLRPNQ